MQKNKFGGQLLIAYLYSLKKTKMITILICFLSGWAIFATIGWICSILAILRRNDALRGMAFKNMSLIILNSMHNAHIATLESDITCLKQSDIKNRRKK